MAKWLGWNGPPEGRGSVEDVVSHTKPVVAALRKHAESIAQDAAFNLDSKAQRRTGDSQVRTVHRGEEYKGFIPDLDSYVILDDPFDKGEKKGAAAGIEKALHPLSDAVDSAVKGAKL